MFRFDTTVLKGTAVPVVVLDHDGRVVFWNDAHSALVGYASHTVTGRDVRELLSTSSGEALTKAMASLSTENEAELFDVGWKTKIGQTTRLAILIRFVAPTATTPAFVVATGMSPQARAQDTEALQRVFELAPMGILVLHRDGGMAFNQRAEEILGVQLSSERGNEQYLPLMRRVDGAPLTMDELPSTRALRRGETVAAMELLVHRSDGTVRTILESAGPVFSPDGRIVRSVVMFEDLTARKADEGAMRAAHAKYEAIVSLAADAIIAIDVEQRIVLFNEGAERIFGWKAQEAIGQPIDVLLPNHIRERHRAEVAAFAEGPAGARRMAEGRATISGVRKDGDVFPAEASITKIALDGSTLLTVVLRDISARKRQENEQRFLAHAGATLVGSLDYEETLSVVARLAVPILADCCIVDLVEERAGERIIRRLKVVHIDPTKSQLAEGLERAGIRKMKSHPIWRALDEQQPVLLREIPSGYLESVAETEEHLRLLRDLAPVSVMSTPLVARARLLGAIHFVSTRAGHVYGEADLRLATELARTAALAMDNSQLYTLAQRAVRARDEVLGLVAHDLRNPLNTIELHAHLLRGMPGEGKRAPQAIGESILKNTNRANRLIQDLLDVRRMEGGQLTMARAPCEPDAILVEANEMMRPAAEDASIELTWTSEPDLPQIEADRYRILQVFSNLIGNAFKFTPRGGRVRLAAERREGGVCFSVADTGPGIGAEQLPHIFDRFWQGRPTDRRGAGLGLAIAKGIVEAHGGRIWAESALGRGSTFFFTLPTPRAPSD